jgi:predicted ATPase
MLEKLHLKNVGPAPELEMEFAPRLNIITGDNGLGKSFILDVAWYVLVGKWAAEGNAKLSFGQQVIPYGKKPAKIEWMIHRTSVKPMSFRSEFEDKSQKWYLRGGFSQEILVLQLSSDSSGSFYDPARKDTDFPPIISLVKEELWDGLNQNGQWICNGLIRDWARWQLENGVVFQQFKSVFEILSSERNEKLEFGALTEVSLGDTRDMPTLKMPYGEEVPIIHASAGVKRILAFAYLLVWSWQEHLRAARITKREPSRKMVILVDELEQHLHPQWQRVIAQALLSVTKALSNELEVQIITTTHSPLVMASLEPLFDPKQDAWFDFNLVKGEVTLEKMQWRKRGGAAAWLRSEAFDLPSDENIQANAILEKASKAFTNPKLSKKKFLELDSELRQTLGETHPFWVRWGFLGQQKGWL